MKLSLTPPALIFYTDDLPSDVNGRAGGVVVRIRPKYLKDAGLREHELAHVELFWLTLGLHVLVKRLSRRYRIWNEARAYRRQMLYRDLHGSFMSLDDAAARLASEHYGFGITYQQARNILLHMG